MTSTCGCRLPGRTCRLKKVLDYIGIEALVLQMAHSPHQRRKARIRLEDLRAERKQLEKKCARENTNGNKVASAGGQTSTATG